MRAPNADRRAGPGGAARAAGRGARLALLAALALWALFAQAATVVVVTSRSGGGYEEAAEAIREEIAKVPGVSLHAVPGSTLDAAAVAKFPEDTAIVLAIGVAAASQSIAAELRVPVLSLLVPRSSWEAIARAAPGGRRGSAIFIDQPPQRQLDLLRAALPGARSVGLVLGPSTQQDAQALRGLAARRGFEIVVEQATRQTELYAALQTVLRSSDVLLALPDPTLVNVSTAQNLLLTSFRYRVPVIGYSASYVRAGALAAVYSTPRQAGTEAAQIARQFVRGGALPAPKYPRYYTVSVNRAVAESLGLPVPDEAALAQRLQLAEGQE